MREARVHSCFDSSVSPIGSLGFPCFFLLLVLLAAVAFSSFCIPNFLAFVLRRDCLRKVILS